MVQARLVECVLGLGWVARAGFPAFAQKARWLPNRRLKGRGSAARVSNEEADARIRTADLLITSELLYH